MVGKYDNSKRELKLLGKKFGRLTVIGKELEKDKWGGTQWRVLCDCGKEKLMRGNSFISGGNVSCGCYAAEQLSKRATTHGMTKTKEHGAWLSMLDRCRNERHKSYKNYGGRGIMVCERWKESFENFYIDMGKAPNGTSIERKNNNGNYCKENCLWATSEEQMHNTRYNNVLTFNGISMDITQWSKAIKMNRSTLYNRIYRNWTVERALTFFVTPHLKRS